MIDVAEKHTEAFIKYSQGFFRLKQMYDKKARSKHRGNLEVIFITGLTGSGKTKMAMKNKGNPDDVFLMHMGDKCKWWDGYEGEETLVLDEYANQIPICQLLSILDGLRKRLPIKGAYTYAAWKRVWITSNLSWKEVHSKALPVHKGSLERRIGEFISFKGCARKPYGFDDEEMPDRGEMQGFIFPEDVPRRKRFTQRGIGFRIMDSENEGSFASFNDDLNNGLI